MNREKTIPYASLLFLLFFTYGCGNIPTSVNPTHSIEAQPSATDGYAQIRPETIISPSPTFTTEPATSTPTFEPSLTPTKQKPILSIQGRFLVTAEEGGKKDEFSIVRYYGEDNQLAAELTLEGKVIEVTTTGDGRFLAYFDEPGTGASGNFYILDTATGEEKKMYYPTCSGPAAWDSSSDRLAVSCGEIIVFAYENNEWVETGNIPLPKEYDQMPAEVRPRMAFPAWSPDGKSIAYINDNSANQLGAASGPFITESECIQHNTTCKAKTKELKKPIDVTSFLFWSSDGLNLDIANVEGKILEVGSISLRTIRSINVDTQIYNLIWTPGNKCIVYSQLQGSFRSQSIYKYCLDSGAIEEEIPGSGYLVGMVEIK